MLCDIDTLSKAKTRRSKRAAHLIPDRHGIQCSMCKKFSCNACLKAITEEAASRGLTDEWCALVGRHLSGEKVPLPFVGHCCEWQPEPQPVKSFFERRYDGYLYIPEYALLINPSFNGVDIHALGRDREHHLDAVWHAVVDDQVAIQCHALNIKAQGSSAFLADAFTKEIIFDGMYTKVRSLFGFVSSMAAIFSQKCEDKYTCVSAEQCV